MGSCVLSQDEKIVSCGDKQIQIGITTTKFGDFRLNGHPDKHHQKLESISRIIHVKNYLRFIPQHSPGVIRLDKKLNNNKIFDCDSVIYCPDQWLFMAMIHCSWITLLKRIIENSFEKIDKPENLTAVIYHGICQDHYEVKQDVVRAFTREKESYQQHFFDNNGKIHLNLSGLIQEKLLESGIRQKNIKNIKICSSHSAYKDFSDLNSRFNPNRAFYSLRFFGDAKRNLIFAKLNGYDFFIASTTGNCPYVILYKH